MFPLIPLKAYETSELEQKFAQSVHDPELQPLLQAAQGLLRFLPASRVTADEALEMLCDEVQE
jgi:hypothetical protein